MIGLILQGWCPWCGSMHWGGALMMLFWIVLLIALVGLVWSLGQRGGWFGGAGRTEDRAEATLRERYARGEIDDATYQRMREELRR